MLGGVVMGDLKFQVHLMRYENIVEERGEKGREGAYYYN